MGRGAGMILAAPTNDDDKPQVCESCGGDLMSCQVKAGLSGRPCCQDCGHQEPRRAAS